MNLLKHFGKTSRQGREIVLDVETTGLELRDGHRVVEIAAVELRDGLPTGLEFHAYINPERDLDPEAEKVHGLTANFLSDKPRFSEIAAEFKKFVGDAPIVITCRGEKEGYVLDKAMVDFEMATAGLPYFAREQWVNVRSWSEEMFGDKGATLDKVADRYSVDRSVRDEKGHGALIDARILAEVYPRLKEDYVAFKERRPRPAGGHNPSP
ncbi:MAG: exonuclease domain-containing protein [Alphaproteobacteria bacterium]|nr:exonuclease domain-containing protein [Alphaproteobacteria bacterium]